MKNKLLEYWMLSNGLNSLHKLGILNAQQRPQLIAQAINCNVCNIQQHLWECNNATKGTNDRAYSGCPELQCDIRIGTSFDSIWIINSLGSCKARQTIGNHHKPIIYDSVRRRLLPNNIRCRRPAGGPIITFRHQELLQLTMQRQNCRHQQMKVDITFPMLIAGQGSGEDVVNAMLMHASCIETHGGDHTSWLGVVSI